MKVLQILPSLNFGGVEIGTVDMARELLHRGHHPYVMSSGGKLVETLRKLGITHYELPVDKKSLQSLLLVEKIEQIINREKIDIVHARSRIPAWLAYLATRRTDAAFITTCHGYYSESFFSRVMGWGDRVIVISHAIGRHMLEHFDVPFDRVRLVHRGLALEKYPFSRRCVSSNNKPREKFVIANIARLTPIKGHREFLKAIRLAKRKLPAIETWLIGSHGKKEKYFEELQTLVEKLGLKESVKFLGPRQDIPELLKEVDLVVLSTTVPEGFGRVLIEAGAMGVPVIATRIGGILDVIDEGKDGLLVPTEDPMAMSDAILQILENYPSAQPMAERFRKKIEDRFTLKDMATRTIAVYEEAVARKKILVMKLGALGDLILIVPSLRQIRTKFPDATISLLVDSNLAPLLEHCPYLDEIITFRRSKGRRFFRRFAEIVLRVRKLHFDISIDFQNNKWTHLIAWLGDIRKRYGYARGFFGGFLTGGLKTFKQSLPPIQHQLRVLTLLGIPKVDETIELWVTEEDRQQVEKLLEESWINPGQPVVGFVLNASARWKTKNWPMEYFAELATRLEKELHARVVLIGDGAQKAYAEKFLLTTTTEAVNLVGKTSIREMVALISRLNCLVSGDTAPIHVASAVGTRTLALFSATDPKRHAPPGKNIRILKAEVECMPCYRTSCNHRQSKAGKPFCLQQVSVDQVFNEVRRILVEDNRIVRVADPSATTTG